MPPQNPNSDPNTLDDAPPVAHLDLKARALVWGVLVLIVLCAAYVLYARGAFERKQTLVLVADNSEGVVVGQDLTFAGFPIGRVHRIELSDEGNARVVVDVPVKDAHWLRESSVFTMESGLVGAPKIRAFTGILTAPPLPDGAVRKLLSGDASAEIPKMVASVRDLLSNLTAMTNADAPLNQTLRNVQTTTENLNGPRGALGVALGDDRAARQRIDATLGGVNSLLAKLNGVVQRADGVVQRVDSIAVKTDGLVGNANAQVFGEDGVEVMSALIKAAKAGNLTIIPVVVTIVYRQDTTLDSEADPNTFLNESLSPLHALINTRDARGAYSMRRIRQEVEEQHGEYLSVRLDQKKIPLPLGWMLSNPAKQEMDSQLSELAASKTDAFPRIA